MSTVWQLNGWQARLQAGSFAGQVNLLTPHEGLSLPLGPDHDKVVLRMLGIELPEPAPGPQNPPADCYVRGDDLVVVYSQATPRPVRVEAYWRASQAVAGLLAIELQVSVQTSLLESAPELLAHSRLPRAEVWRLLGADSRAFERPGHTQDKTIRLQPEQGPGCLLFRLAGSDLSYVEMIHPSDFRWDELAPAREDGHLLRHRLFSGELEKGVILRGRVRGLVLPRENDEQAAAEAFTAFSQAPPPLTT
jgi:hypothetical protein